MCREEPRRFPAEQPSLLRECQRRPCCLIVQTAPGASGYRHHVSIHGDRRPHGHSCSILCFEGAVERCAHCEPGGSRCIGAYRHGKWRHQTKEMGEFCAFHPTNSACAECASPLMWNGGWRCFFLYLHLRTACRGFHVEQMSPAVVYDRAGEMMCGTLSSRSFSATHTSCSLQSFTIILSLPSSQSRG